MSKDHYRNISVSAYIEYDFLDCTGKFAENVLRICSHFMLIFLSPCGLCSRSLCTSLCGGEKCTFLVHKVIRNRSIWGPCQFLIFITKHLVKILPIYLSGNMKEFIWKKSGKVKNLYGTCEGFLKKNEKHIWKNAEFDCKNERNYMTKIWKSEEFVWKRAGFIKKQSDEFPWKNDEFAWTSERIYMVQRYSKYRFFDVNCILRYSKYCFSNSIPGRGNQNFNSIFCVGGGPFLYIYIYML